MHWPGSLRQKLCRNTRGVALVEFAILFPVLLGMYVSVFSLTDAIACNRKVTITARTVTDLATRYSSLSEAEVTSILNGSAQVMYPYSSGNAVIVLSEVQVTSPTEAKVIWSRASTGTPLIAGTRITIPANTTTNDTFMLLGQVRYTYTPSYWLGAAPSFNLTDTIMMLPRISSQVPIS